jgi:PTS system nitrogen regulatory IIA component
MRITDFLHREGIISDLKSATKDDVLVELVEPIALAHPHMDKDALVRSLIEREDLGSTGIGGGVAIPHGKMDGLRSIAASFGKSPRGIDFHSMDNKPAHLFFLLVAPKNSASDHLKALARVSRVVKDPILKKSLLNAQTADEIYRLLEESDLRMP